MKRIVFTSIILAFSLCACNKEQKPQAAVADEIRFNICYPTKATATNFESGDAVSLFAVEYNGEDVAPVQVGGNYINNEKLSYNGSAWTPARTLYWSANPCDFYALYPYREMSTVDALPFEVASDQNADGYEQSDLLYAKTEKVSRNESGVTLQFKHILSKLRVNIVKGEAFEGEIPDDIVVHVYNTNVECFLSMNTGSIEKNAMGAKKTITMKKINNQQFEAVLVPQNIEKKTPLIEVSMGGIAYLLEYSISFRAGYCYTVDLTLNTSPDQEQIEISIDPGEEGWE